MCLVCQHRKRTWIKRFFNERYFHGTSTYRQTVRQPTSPQYIKLDQIIHIHRELEWERNNSFGIKHSQWAALQFRRCQWQGKYGLDNATKIIYHLSLSLSTFFFLVFILLFSLGAFRFISARFNWFWNLHARLNTPHCFTLFTSTRFQCVYTALCQSYSMASRFDYLIYCLNEHVVFTLIPRCICRWNSVWL